MTAFPACGVEHLETQILELAYKVRPNKRGWKRRLNLESQRIYEQIDCALANIQE